MAEINKIIKIAESRWSHYADKTVVKYIRDLFGNRCPKCGAKFLDETEIDVKPLNEEAFKEIIHAR